MKMTAEAVILLPFYIFGGWLDVLSKSVGLPADLVAGSMSADSDPSF